MSSLVLFLLTVSGLGHSMWNAIAKTIPQRDAFFTLITMSAVVLYLPLAVFLLQRNSIPPQAWLFALGSVGFEVVYFLALARAYRLAPLITVYPIARGTSPVLAALFGLAFTRMTAAPLGLAGIVMIALGIFFVNQPSLSFTRVRSAFANQGAFYALLTGTCTAIYSVFDWFGAHVMSGILFIYIVYIGIAIGKWAADRVLLPSVSHVALFRRHPVKILIGGTLAFSVNATVLYCMQTTPVAYVTAVREVGILFTAIIGVVWLKESVTLPKVLSITAIVIGIFLIKFS
ncbi:MAG: EamA family transporter [Bacilli bacterium]